jgi:cardiolipin synthase
MQDHDLSPAEKRLRLLKQGKKGLIHLIFSRTGIMTLLILLQLGLMLLMVLRFQDYQVHYYGLFTLLSLITVLFLLNSDTDPNAKITWLLLVLLAPVVGMLLYAYVHTDLGHRALKERMRHIHKHTLRLLPAADADTDLARELGYAVKLIGHTEKTP